MKKNLAILLFGAFLCLGCNQDITHTNSPTDTPTDTSGTDNNASNIEINEPNTTTPPIEPPTTLTKLPKEEEKAKEWYIRIIAEDTSNDLQSTSAQLGQLDSDTAVEDHSLKAIAPFDSFYLDVVFKDPSGISAGEYKSNFHVNTATDDSWEFTVKASDSNATIILSWRGLYILDSYTDSEDRVRYHEFRSLSNPLLYSMTLVDTVTNTEIPVLSNSAANEYVFHMDGSTERTFQWILKDTPSEIIVKKLHKTVTTTLSTERKLKTLQIQALRKDAKSKSSQLIQKRILQSATRQPPKFKVLVQ